MHSKQTGELNIAANTGAEIETLEEEILQLDERLLQLTKGQ